MTRFILRRLLQGIPTLLGIIVITFALTRLSPGDPVKLMVGGSFDITPEDRAVLAASLGLNDPLPVQFGRYLRDMLTFNFGNSFYYHRPVVQLIGERIGNTLQLQVLALLVSLAIGVPLGIVAALRRGRPSDHAIRTISVIGHAVPTFWFGLLFVLVLGVQLRWFPVGSMNAIGKTDLADRLYHLVGPVVTLALAGIALYPRYLRTEMLEVLSQDYVRTARSKGLREPVVVVRHVLRNALIPVVTILGGILTIVIGGSVITETIFNWPGLGRLFFEGLTNKDFPLIQASVVCSSILLIVSYILRDIIYALVDPRITVG
jgi:ABC-type dipeptide/oligopeptide/nickel transport system permease component